jgi:hypothetical protein
MPHLDLSLTAPFALDDVVVRVTLASGEDKPCVVRGGRLNRDFGARPVKIRLSAEPPPRGEAALALAPSIEPGAPTGDPADVVVLFERGWDVPADGRLALQILWGAHCHSEAAPTAPSDRRFASAEHMVCAELVGLDEAGAPLYVGGIKAPFINATPLPVGQNSLPFGNIVALGGDFYAHLDDAATGAFGWAWPEIEGLAGWLVGDYRAMTLAGDTREAVRVLLKAIDRDRDAHRNAAGEFVALALDTLERAYPARRYLALSSQNYCHFVCPAPGRGDGDNEALRLYRAYHARALDAARAARDQADAEAALLGAIAIDAFGCHFLTDLFASGHIRVPRRVLGERYGILRGSLYMSLRMHNEDNEAGLWCTTRLATTPRQMWRAFGDGKLRSEVASCHRQRVREAVRRSAEEVFRAYCGVAMPMDMRAEAILPVPLPPGTKPSATDQAPEGCTMSDHPANGWPMYTFARSRLLIERDGPPSVNRYRYVDDLLDVPEEEKGLVAER